MAAKKWSKLTYPSRELQLKGTLNGGQSFRWRKIENSENNDEVESKVEWIGVFSNRVWRLKQNENQLLYQVYETSEENNEPPVKKICTNENDNTENSTESKYDLQLKEYFRLDLDLTTHYKRWSNTDIYFKSAAVNFYGIRILAQDPVENIFSFICSSNNNISRISSMVDKLCTFYGRKICEIDEIAYHAFPEVESLAQAGVETKLKELGFGYRAGYIHKSAKIIMEKGGEEWIENLKKMEYPEAKKTLMTLTGVGAKVADCICLMSLGHLQSIPVDTHVFQIAAKHYLKHLSKHKSVTERIYNEIGEHFRTLYGPLAGWAHTVLFCADLKIFQISSNSSEVNKSKRKT